MTQLTQRKAVLNDLPRIVELLLEDDLAQTRESQDVMDPRYAQAFHKIDADVNQYVMVVEEAGQIIATCHLSILPSLTFIGSTRMQIEAVRVAKAHRGQKIGQWMFDQAIDYAKAHGVSIVQLTTNKQRAQAKQFYEKQGFEATHEGFKRYL